MPIPESQLETWSKQGAITTSANTNNSVKVALDAYTFPSAMTYNVYLQGSYKNDTNVYGESDVDIVVELTSMFYSNLSEDEQRFLRFTSSSHTLIDFKQEVLKCLIQYYGRNMITVGNKVIKVHPGSSRLDLDVLVCCSYRYYYAKNDPNGFVSGITFFTPDNTQVINFPKRHSDNATTKHQETSQWFKPTVRLFKNIRNYLVANNNFNKKTAPSYFIECMLSNIPNNKYGVSYQNTLGNCVDYLMQNNVDGFLCLNRIRGLWGQSNENWNKNDAGIFVSEIVTLWSRWYA